MVKLHPNIILAVIGLTVVVSGCTSGQDVTPIVKAIPEVQQFLKEHPDAKITVTYWSKEDVAKFEQEISQQCDKPITPAAMYKATINEGDLKSIAWIDAATQTLICSTTEGKGGTPVPTPTTTHIPTVTPKITLTPTPAALDELAQGYRLLLGDPDYENGQVKRITLKLLREGRFVSEQTLTVGNRGNNLNLYDSGTLIVKARYDAFLIETLTPTLSQYTVKLADLVQYDKVTGNVIFTKDTFVLNLQFAVAIFTPTSTMTPTPTATSTLFPPPTPINTAASTPTPAATTPTPASTSLPYNKTMTVGETWDMGGGYALTTQAIDAMASPRQVWIVFSKDGHKLDDKVIREGYAYTYGTIFSTKIASIFRITNAEGVPVDAVRLENSTFL